MSLLAYTLILLRVSYFSVVIPGIFYLYKFKGISSRAIHTIGWLTIVSGLFDLAGFLFIKYTGSNAVILNVYFIVQYILLNLFYFQTLFKKAYRNVIVLGLVNVSVAILIFEFFSNSIFINQNFVWLTLTFIVLIYSFLAIQKFVSFSVEQKAENQGLFWINLGLLISGLLSFLPFAFTDELLRELTDSGWGAFVWSFVLWSNIIRNALFTIGLYHSTKRA
jgi:hypothetical protein